MILAATIAVNSSNDTTIRKIILAGADVLRYNLAYDTMENNLQNIAAAVEIIDNLNTRAHIMVDLPTNKTMLGDFDDKTFSVKEGGELIFKSAPYSPDCNQFIPVSVEKLGEKTRANQTITIGTGAVAIQVNEILDSDTIKAISLNNGTISALKGFNISTVLDADKLKRDYLAMVEKLAPIQPRYIVIPFWQQDIVDAVANSIPPEWRSKIAVKIENQAGITNIEDICKNENNHLLVIDRAELGINVPYEKIGLIQKEIMTTAQRFQKPVFISSQILHSTMNSYIPLKSDILDLTNIVLSGASGIVLRTETGVGRRPTFSVAVARKVIAAVEQYLEKNRSAAV